MQFDVVVEIPKGQRNKYEIDHTSGKIRLDRTLFTSMVYPADYGYIDGTLGEDGDPLDALVFLEEPTFPGCLIACHPIAMFEMTDEAGPDNKILCVPSRDPRYSHFLDLQDFPGFLLESVQHFFESYKDLEPTKQVSDGKWRDRASAEACVEAAFQRARPDNGH